ncbi:uncharacterized protein N7515_005253 [Penicillium bovifimosum]|uniref:Uncharacterized protein n=1 Tax=Penicillium bovifimosum TaxID=126998 RepID=A0A9W9KZN3_9EURO|nr:uncharacterized protein N7515_005253 [Penicillium bovifimosum]KAJ5129214.1 hypothetical protein N7515_005253 [Penicillium bovifimosum]
MPNPPLSRSWAEIRLALEHARDGEDGPGNTESAAVLEAAITELWNRIQAQPDNYVLSPDEFALFNYFLASRYRGSPVAQSAVARFWNNYQATTNCDGVTK